MRKEKINNQKVISNIVRYKSLCLFILGLVMDLIALGRIDKIIYLIQHALYLIIIFYVFVRFDFNEMRQEIFQWKKVSLSPVDIMQFFYGSLLSHYFYFYFRSTSLVTWLFLIFITLLLLLNELAYEKKWYLSLKIILFPFCTLAYLVYLVPIIMGTLGIGEFYLSLMIYAILMILLPYLFISNKGLARKIWLASLIIFLATLFLYQKQFIPPVPLHVTKSGFFTHLEAQPSVHQIKLTANKERSFKKEKINFEPQTKVYYVAKIFSPSNFHDKLFLEWRIWQNNDWQLQDKIIFQVVGKEDGEYRGLAWKENWSSGQYLILLLTEDNRILDKFELEVLDESHVEQYPLVSDYF